MHLLPLLLFLQLVHLLLVITVQRYLDWEDGVLVVAVPLHAVAVQVQELMDGGEAGPNSISTCDEAQMLDLLRRTQTLENQRTSLYGIVLLLMGVAMLALHDNVGGSDVQDFVSGLLLGISVGAMLVGIYVTILGFSKRD